MIDKRSLHAIASPAGVICLLALDHREAILFAAHRRGVRLELALQRRDHRQIRVGLLRQASHVLRLEHHQRVFQAIHTVLRLLHFVAEKLGGEVRLVALYGDVLLGELRDQFADHGNFLAVDVFRLRSARIGVFQQIDQLRKQKRLRAESIEQLDEESGGVERQMPVVTPNPTERMERGELRQRIDEALGKLSCEHRTVLILHEFEELEYKEIAKRMQCSIGTVMSRLFYARRKIATLLAGWKREESR